MAGIIFLSISDFIQRDHHEVALVHQRMRNLQVGLINHQIVIEQDINVDRTVGIH